MSDSLPPCDTGLHVFYSAYSNNAQRVLLLLAEKGIEAEMHEVNLLKSEQLTEEYLRVNPKGEVPAIVHNGKAMHESCAIMRYLDAEFPGPGFTPQGAEDRKQMEQWLDSATGFHMKGIVNYVYAKGLGRLPTPRDWEFYKRHIPHRAKFHEERRKGLVGRDATAASAVLDEQFAKLETALTNNEWLVGNTYSLADMVWFSNANVLRISGYSLSDFPRLCDWMERIQARPAYREGVARRLLKLPDWLLRCIVKLNNKLGHRS
jgi:glutathione S-transferase